MTKSKRAKAANASNLANTLIVQKTADETGKQAIARKVLEPSLRHGITASAFAGKILGSVELPDLMDFAKHVQSAGGKAEQGDLSMASRMLAAQAITLDSMFTELARRAAINMGEYINAAERYGRLALKAQSNCRAALEALAKLHQPREQTVRHVHVNEGGQAIVADQFHDHRGAAGNGNSIKQSDATGTAGQCASLPGPDPLGNGMPISSGEGEAAMQDARRHKSGSAYG